MISLLGLSLLMGMAPTDQRVRPPPAPHLDWDLATAWRWGGRPDWRAFQGRWGGSCTAMPNSWHTVSSSSRTVSFGLKM